MYTEVAVLPLTVGTAGAVAQAATEYSTSTKFNFASTAGIACVFLTSTAGSVTVSQQVSLDNLNWYDPVDAASAGLGTVCTAQAVTTGKYIYYNPVLSKHIRFKVVEGNTAPTVVTLKFVFQEEA